jgi:2-polyprenyl-6-methoxyphenol hydroxylase-like FAD-dependent oxidoreductase
LKIAIAGAGIGGLAAASLLARQGHLVTVHDQFDTPRPVGSGLVIQPVGQAVLEKAGALAAASAFGNPIKRMQGHEADRGRPVLDVRYDRSDPSRHGLAIHRAALFDALLNAALAAGARLVTGARVQAAHGGTLTFENGAKAGPFDLVIDSTGAGSPLSPIVARALPYGAIWSTVNWPDTPLQQCDLTQCYRKADRMVGVLPIGQLPGQTGRKATIFWSLPAGAHAEWQQRGLASWRAEATALWPAFAPFADQITDANQMTMARYAHGTLRRPYGDRIVHIGDAAHRASPQLGQGANMALLDALALTQALTVAQGPAALALYAKARRWHVAFYQLMSAAFTPQYQSDSRWLPALRDRVIFPLSQVPPVPRLLTSIVCGTMLPPLGRLQRQ